ncbi:MAG: NAD-dependent epimerase/dehydratase family protein [Candidatus Acidiferrales bacterium]
MARRNPDEKVSVQILAKSKNHDPRRPGGPRRQRLLVTGGAGFIGANLVRLLLDHGHQVTVLDNLAAGRREYLDGLSVEFIHGDILDRTAVERAVAGKDGVVHLAAQTGVPGSLRDPRKDCEINVIGVLNILEACRAEKERTALLPDSAHGYGLRLIFASSNAPLGRQPPPATEDKAPLPISPYGASKLAGEAYCLAYHGSWGLGTVVLRFGNVYGPFSEHKGSVVTKFLKDISAGGVVVVDGDGQQTRDFIYVGDLCRAILLALESEVCGEVFQVATGTETTIGQLAEMVKLMSQSDAAIAYGPPRQADIRKNYSSIGKIRRALAWEPRVDLKRGLEMTMQWFHEWLGAHAQ